MSDPMQAEGQPQASTIPNYSTTIKRAKWNGDDEDWIEVRYGTNPADTSLPEHILEVRRTDMADTFDLVEIASSQVENDIWLSLATVAMSVRSIDGVPQPASSLSKAVLRNTLKKLGATGVRAVRQALVELVVGLNEANQKAAAGN